MGTAAPSAGSGQALGCPAGEAGGCIHKNLIRATSQLTAGTEILVPVFFAPIAFSDMIRDGLLELFGGG